MPATKTTNPQRNDKKGKRGLKRLYNAFFFSLDGIKAAWQEEEGFRQVLSIGIMLSIIACFIAQSWLELILLVLPCVLSIIVELINSAIENAIDFTSLEIHPLAKKAKDMGSAIQLIACLFVAFVWGSYLLTHFVL
ncbi:diacylglycerol kinase [uncultured Helicobacter sp.]|uniref:diacylglycerol kinase n=1 Tax=uncultured Helicobacter sp. TaxID=175537 RepID=UPI002602B5A9|nr:diacylglycerol kinase [uncultured Helicobacter sp.]